ncbi:MAG: LTA synthase family protein, partial [Ghiorsea sp.]
TVDSDAARLNHWQPSVFQGKKNVILVILESFGHEHIGYLGGTPTTPKLDQLAASGLAFHNMYATGNRTSWGVSSVLTGLYPLPNREYVKALKSQHHFYTIAQSFKQHGYTNTFLYSGDADFDNMRAFMLSNGYDNVLGKESFDASLEKYTWGYADEDLYDKAVQLIEQQVKQQKPYFLNLLSLSSHEPFDYPAGKTPLYANAPIKGFANSIKYADFALGKFYDTFQAKGLFKNTVVAFIADHGNNAYGTQDVPIDRYKIAAVIMDESLKHQRYDKLSSQIDFGPTLLDIAGLDVQLPSVGASIFQHPRDSALLLYHQNYAYLLADRVIIYKNNHPAQAYSYDHDSFAYQQQAQDI